MDVGLAGSLPSALLRSRCLQCRTSVPMHITAGIAHRPAAARLHASTVLDNRLQVSPKNLVACLEAYIVAKSQDSLDNLGRGVCIGLTLLLQTQWARQLRRGSSCQSRQKEQQAVCSTAGAVAVPFDDAGEWPWRISCITPTQNVPAAEQQDVWPSTIAHTSWGPSE